jgi:hypothetical protein
MSIKDNIDILNKFLDATTAEAVDSVLADSEFFKNVEWVQIGGKKVAEEVNAGRVEGQMKYPENAFVEKITNSIDAILMKKCRERGIEPTDRNKAPKSLQEAIVKFIGTEEDFEKLRKRHSDIIITAEGKKEYPTLTIIDRGEGQEPEQLPTTILGLSNRLKVDISFVYGKYHQGGSAALRFSGSKPTSCYQLVLSKRAETLKPQNNTWGFALIRKVFINSRLPSYQYCVDKNDKIFTVPGDTTILFAKRNNIDFPDGTLIRVYDYQLTRPTNIVFGSGSLSDDINKKLLQPAIPIHLKELRKEYAEGRTTKSTQWTIGGLLRIIRDKKDLIREEFFIPADLGPLGKKNIHFIVLKHISEDSSVDTYKERKEKIFYLENGLSLNNQQVGFISDICQLPNLADYILCFIDISDVSPEQTNLFHASREEFASTPDYKDLKNKLKIVFEDPKFIELQREYKNKDILSTQLLDKDTNKILESALKADTELLKDLELGEDLQFPSETEEPKYPEPEEEYTGKYLPIIFELIGSDQREINERSFGIVSFRTDAADNFLDRINDQGVCDPPSSVNFSIVRRAPRKGVISFRVQAKEEAAAGNEEKLEFKLEVPTRNFSKGVEVKIKIIPKTKFVGEKYPSFITPQKDTLRIPKDETRKLSFKTDAENDFFSSGRGKLQFESDDLKLLGYRLKNGLLQLSVKCTAKNIGKKDDIKVDVDCDNGMHFPMLIHLEVVEDEKSEKFKKPSMWPVNRDGWKGRGWDESGMDIAEVVKDIDGLNVYYNSESKALELLKNRIRTEDMPAAEKKYISDCYIQALHLYFEFKDEPDYKNYVRRAMKALGKSMPAMLSKQFRS